MATALNTAAKGASKVFQTARVQRPQQTFQFVSNLQLRSNANVSPVLRALKPRAENLCLLGDIADPAGKAYSMLLKSLTDEYDGIFVVAGHKEVGDKTTRLVMEYMYNLCGKFINCHFMEGSCLRLRDDFFVVGSMEGNESDETGLLSLCKGLYGGRSSLQVEENTKYLHLSYRPVHESKLLEDVIYVSGKDDVIMSSVESRGKYVTPSDVFTF
jgi:hypothetical protein